LNPEPVVEVEKLVLIMAVLVLRKQSWWKVSEAPAKGRMRIGGDEQVAVKVLCKMRS
jgi:hypothetical protein